MSAYSSAAVRNTRLTGVINRRNNMAKIQHSHVPVAPSHGQVSTTFTSMLSLSLHSQRLHANTDFKEDLALHYSKVKKWKVFFFFFLTIFCLFVAKIKGLKGQQHSAPRQNLWRMHYYCPGIKQAQVSRCHKQSGNLLLSTQDTSSDSSSQYRNHKNVA